MDDSRYDLVVVGAGNAGLAAAATARECGLRVCVIEKTARLGGQLEVSSAQFSAAGTRRQRERGIVDHPEMHLREVLDLGHRLANESLLRLAVYAAPQAVDWLDDAGFPFHPDCPVVAVGHEPYLRPRVYWGGTGGSAGGHLLRDTLIRLLDPDDPAVTVLLETQMTRLLIGPGGRVDGVETATSTGEPGVVLGRWTIVATGGYAASRELLAELHPEHPALISASLPHATGDGLVALRDLGAEVGYFEQTFCPTVGLISDADHPGRAVHMFDAMAILNGRLRQPHEIWVNLDGERFVREDTRSPFEKEEAVRRQREGTLVVVFDQRALDEGEPLIGPRWTRDRVRDCVGKPGFVQRADTLAELAAIVGVDAPALEATVDRYNSSLDSADDFGRVHRPHAIEQPPYYGLRLASGLLASRGGIRVDDRLRPVRDDGSSPIDGCLVVGELLGMGQLSGDSFAGGMSVGSALGLGRLAAAQVAADLASAVV